MSNLRKKVDDFFFFFFFDEEAGTTEEIPAEQLQLELPDSDLEFFDGNIRAVWHKQQEKWYFSVIDVIEALTGTDRPRKYWSDLKKKLFTEGSELSEKIGQLKMKAEDGKMRKTDSADMEQILRLIQSIPSPKAEPFKIWLARVGSERLDETADPELAIERAISDYKKKGYSDKWISQRLRGIDIRKELTDEWQRSGVKSGYEFAILTDILTKAWSGKSTREYKEHKGLRKENLRDNMTNTELALNLLAEVSTTELSKNLNPEGFSESKNIVKEGGEIAGNARKELERKLGRSVLSRASAKDVHLLDDK